MNAVAARTEYTPEDLLAMPDGDNYELVDGRLVERKLMGFLSCWIGLEIAGLLRDYLKNQPIGRIFSAEMGYQCFPDAPRYVRKPVLSFMTHERLPKDWFKIGLSPIPPDLAVEVVSPNDLTEEVERKIHEYLKAGVPLIWVIVPNVRVVRVHRADRTFSYLCEDDELSGETVLPGFRCLVGALFPPRAEVVPDVAGR